MDHKVIMKDDLPIKNGIVIPGHELEVTASRAGGPGGQHVNKASTRITLRWNLSGTGALNDEQKKRVLERLRAEVTSDGDILVYSGVSRSQQQNKKMALANLAQKVRKALHVPKKRMPTKASKKVKEARLQVKKQRGALKKMRSKKFQND